MTKYDLHHRQWYPIKTFFICGHRYVFRKTIKKGNLWKTDFWFRSDKQTRLLPGVYENILKLKISLLEFLPARFCKTVPNCLLLEMAYMLELTATGISVKYKKRMSRERSKTFQRSLQYKGMSIIMLFYFACSLSTYFEGLSVNLLGRSSLALTIIFICSNSKESGLDASSGRIRWNSFIARSRL